MIVSIEGGGVTLSLSFEGTAPPVLIYFGPQRDLTVAPTGPAPPHQWSQGEVPRMTIFPETGFGYTGEPAFAGFRNGSGSETRFHVSKIRRRRNAIWMKLEDRIAGLEARLTMMSRDLSKDGER
jgi:hypothetical protein